MFTLPQLSYSFAALEPVIDAKTMEIHYSKHHQAYLDKLNAALADHADLQKLTVEELLSDLSQVPEKIKTAVVNHGGGHYNHTLFWSILAPEGQAQAQPQGKLLTAIESIFKSFANFQQEFETATAAQFGSGWGWLVADGNGGVKIVTTPNQNSPLSDGLTPIFGVDVWEHAYYLNYQNRRPDYLKAIWKIVDWAEVEKRYQQ